MQHFSEPGLLCAVMEQDRGHPHCPRKGSAHTGLGTQDSQPHGTVTLCPNCLSPNCLSTHTHTPFVDSPSRLFCFFLTTGSRAGTGLSLGARRKQGTLPKVQITPLREFWKQPAPHLAFHPCGQQRRPPLVCPQPQCLWMGALGSELHRVGIADTKTSQTHGLPSVGGEENGGSPDE